MCAIRDGQVRVGDAVAVFGMGAIGLMVVQIAKLSGAYPIIAVDPLENRQKVAQICGADLILDPTTCDAGVKIKKATGNRGVDVAIDYSANVHALQAAIRGVAFGGNVVAGAAPAPYGPGLDLGAEAHYNRPQSHLFAVLQRPQPRISPMGRKPRLRHLLATAHRGKTDRRTHCNTRSRV